MNKDTTNKMKYNIIIPVAYREYPFLPKTIKYIQKNLDAEHIYIITHIDMINIMPTSIKKNPKCSILDENLIIKGVSFQEVQELLRKYKMKDQRVGWYLQQFIKMGFAQSKYCDQDYYLSWDADTLPIQHINFFDIDGKPFFDMKSEHHQPYFDTINNLFTPQKTNKSSYIAEHMLFKKEIMLNLLAEIEKNKSVQCKNWTEQILLSVNPNEFCVFSEFETYGNYCFNYYSDLYKERQLSSFRCGGVIMGRFISDEIIQQLSIDVYIISFELYNTPPFPWSIAHKLYVWYIKSCLIRIQSFKEKISKYIRYSRQTN